MKKCPHCAEEIQDEAKICRFCGRSALPEPSKWIAAFTVIGWTIGGMIASIPAGMFAASLGIYDMLCATPALLGTILIGLIINWKTRRIRKGFFIFFALYFGIGILIIVITSLPAASNITHPAAPTNTPWPTRRPQPIASTATVNPCTLAYNVTSAFEGRTLCVYGEFHHQRLLPYNNTARLYTAPEPAFFFLCENCYFPDLNVGSCIQATGTIELTTDDQPFINLPNHTITFCR